MTSLQLINEILKAPPGPPPRPGLKWHEETHRWIRPKEAKGSKPSTESKPTRNVDSKSGLPMTPNGFLKLPVKSTLVAPTRSRYEGKDDYSATIRVPGSTGNETKEVNFKSESARKKWLENENMEGRLIEVVYRYGPGERYKNARQNYVYHDLLAQVGALSDNLTRNQQDRVSKSLDRLWKGLREANSAMRTGQDDVFIRSRTTIREGVDSLIKHFKLDDPQVRGNRWK